MNIRRAYYDICYGFRNILRWLPTIWRDRDYDWAYVLDLLEAKLKHVAEATEREKHFEGWETDLGRQRQCIRLIQRIQDETAWDETNDKHTAKWGQGTLTSQGVQYPELSPDQQKQEWEERCIMLDEADRAVDREWAELFRLLRDHMREWWM